MWQSAKFILSCSSIWLYQRTQEGLSYTNTRGEQDVLEVDCKTQGSWGRLNGLELETGRSDDRWYEQLLILSLHISYI